ncbi:MAG TPA: N-acetylmuramoyl-L-alanine amidase [Gemmatimonadaceae bacterium]
MACAPAPAPVVSPLPAPPDTIPAPRPRADTAPALPAIPSVEGPLAIRVVYPPVQHLIESRDSNFIFGSIGNGRASLTINGVPARVYPNGAFMAFVANPPSSAPRYDLVATVGNDSARVSLPVRVQDPRPTLALTGPLIVDTTSITPRAPATSPMLLRGDELVRVAVRAPTNATVWAAWPSGSQWLVPSTTLSDSASGSAFGADIPARALRDGATLYVARGADTLRYALLRPDLVDTLTTRLVRAGDAPMRPDTDRVIIGRPVPGGTYKWFLFPGTTLEITGKMAGFTRVKLDSGLEIWIADADALPLPSGTPIPRRVTLNAHTRTAPDWVDIVVPVQGGERPAFVVNEGARSLSVTLYGTQANTDIINYADNDTLLRTVEWKQVLDDRAELDVTLRQPLCGYLVLWEDGSFVLRVRRRPVIDPRNPLRGLTIAVDPGHPPIGATGPTGLYEAQAVLPVGEKVRALLEQRGAHVVMTRTTNDPVELGLRPIIARRENANAFVSIHLNAYGDGVNPLVARNGSGTYFFHALSEPLARSVERGLVRYMGLPNLGVYYDNLAVVRPSWMPMVLTEGAFVIIPEQEAALRTPEFQARYAQGIVDGLEEYFRWLAKQ